MSLFYPSAHGSRLQWPQGMSCSTKRGIWMSSRTEAEADPTNILNGAYTVAGTNSSRASTLIAVPSGRGTIFTLSSVNTTPPASAASTTLASFEQRALATTKNDRIFDEVDLTTMDLSQLPELRHRIRCQVDRVIRQSFNHETCASSYLQAMQRIPELVRTETDPLQFVRYSDYDLWAGAKRLCLYWTERLALFGPDRAFLPMTLTGQGALMKDDISTIHAGFPAILQSSSKDTNLSMSDEKTQSRS